MLSIERVNQNNFIEFQKIVDLCNHSKESWELFQNNSFRYCYLLIIDNINCAYIDFSLMYERAELNQIFVKEEYSNNHYSNFLMEFFIEICLEMGCMNITLEVNENNVIAYHLYEKYGFLSVGIREKYYKDGNAILMERKL